MLRVAAGHARRVLKGFLHQTERAERVQQQVLFEKIRRNTDSEFGRDFGFVHIKSYDDFRKQLPIMTYDDLSPYVERVKRGEIGAMFGGGQRVHMLAKTSGTSDKPKYVPVTSAFLREYRSGWNAFGVKAIMDHPGCFLRHIVQMTSPMDEECSEGGLQCGAITGLMAKSQKRLVRRYYVVPPIVGYIGDSTARYYTAMRFAVTKDVAFMITASPATQLNLAVTADQHRAALIRDVHDGTISDEFEIPEIVRSSLRRRLKRDPVGARRLESIVARTGRLLPKDYWRLGFLANWIGGTMGLYLRDYPIYFGDAPVRDIGLLASEGRMSLPIEDGVAGGILDVSSSFFEFIPESQHGDENPDVLLGHQLEVGQRYYILLTTSAGFYRYDIGDCVQVNGFHGQAPVIEFLHKGDGISSITGEKLTERQVVEAYRRCLGQTDAGHFVLAPHWGHPPHYVLHLESGRAGDRSADDSHRAEFNHEDRQRAGALAQRLDQRLGEINFEYASKRQSGRLGPIIVNLIDAGFLATRGQRLARRYRRANEQYKHRYLLTTIGDDAEFPRGRALICQDDRDRDDRRKHASHSVTILKSGADRID